MMKGEKMKVYSISKGAYNDGDYLLCGVSLDKDKAEQIAERAQTDES